MVKSTRVGPGGVCLWNLISHFRKDKGMGANNTSQFLSTSPPTASLYQLIDPIPIQNVKEVLFKLLNSKIPLTSVNYNTVTIIR